MNEGDEPLWNRVHTREVMEDDLLPLLEAMAADGEYGFDFALTSPLLDAAEWLGIGEIATSAIPCRSGHGSLCLALVKMDIGSFLILSGLHAEAG